MFKGLLRLAGSVALLFSVLSSVAFGEDDRFFTGTLGKMPIVLEMNLGAPSNVSGRYLYQKYHRDIPLSGAFDGQTLVLNEGQERYGEDTPRPELRLQETPNGWQGEWRSPKGKTLKVSLVNARLPPVPADAVPYIASLRNTAPYDYLRLQGLTLKPGKKQDFMGYTLQWWSEPESKISLFEIVSGYSPQERKRLNQQLMGRLWQEVTSYHNCLLGSAQWAYVNLVAQPQLLTSSVVSINISMEYSCGGQHPDYSEKPLNLDAKTGKVLTLEDVLWVGQGKPLHYEERLGDSDEQSPELREAYSTYRRQEFAPWLIRQFTVLHPTEMQASGTDDGMCVYANAEPWQYASWYFTDQGIYLNPYFPHALAPCSSTEWSVLPYNLIKQQPGGVRLQLP
ncbi:hypothetical protein [Pseudomonas purpurea]|uniref:hypothetical protein n=1 Tax=Pseudomonas purpurea TaxID=3136737 RepID=UPI003267CEBF